MKTAIAALLLVGATAPIGESDIPHAGDHMTVVYRDDSHMVAVDAAGTRDEEDGSKSVILYIVSVKDGKAEQVAGRLAVKCHSHQFRFVSSFLLDSHGKIVDSLKGDIGPYETIPPDSVAESAAQFICRDSSSSQT
jgi:hypothetical protein